MSELDLRPGPSNSRVRAPFTWRILRFEGLHQGQILVPCTASRRIPNYLSAYLFGKYLEFGLCVGHSIWLGIVQGVKQTCHWPHRLHHLAPSSLPLRNWGYPLSPTDPSIIHPLVMYSFNSHVCFHFPYAHSCSHFATLFPQIHSST